MNATGEQPADTAVEHRRPPSFWAVIPAGGAGSRLWPLSRATRPKFLLPLLGKRSLLQQTFDRLQDLTPAEHIIVVCGPAHAAAITRQLPDLPSANLIVEPSPRGTGPAIALATALIQRDDPDAIVGSFAADHDVTDRAAFCAAVRTAVAAAHTGALVTIGLTPTRPETGYGYIERTDDIVVTTAEGTAWRAKQFVEKPDRERAATYVAAGTFLWNASMFVWQARALIDEMKRLQPEMAAAIRMIVHCWESPRRDAITADAWADIPATTIDQGIMEHANRVAVVPAEMGWSDVGDFDSLGELIEQDGLGNSVRGDFLQIETTNSVVWSETGRMVATVGLDNVIIVDTPDALLVVDRAKSQEVRRVVERLKELMRTELS